MNSHTIFTEAKFWLYTEKNARCGKMNNEYSLPIWLTIQFRPKLSNEREKTGRKIVCCMVCTCVQTLNFRFIFPFENFNLLNSYSNSNSNSNSNDNWIKVKINVSTKTKKKPVSISTVCWFIVCLCVCCSFFYSSLYLSRLDFGQTHYWIVHHFIVNNWVCACVSTSIYLLFLTHITVFFCKTGFLYLGAD